MHDHKFALVDFNGNHLLTMFDGETVRVAMKPLAEAMGYSWQGQHQKITDDPVLREGIKLILIPSSRGDQEMLTLPLDLMHGWMFKLSPSKAKPEFQDVVKRYQRECYRVLHDYWTKGAAINPRMGGGAGGSSGEVLTLIKALEKASNPAAQRVIYDMLVAACDRVQVTPPLLQDLAGYDVDAWRDTREMFAAAVRDLADAGTPANLHRKPDQYLAIHIRSFLTLCRTAKVNAPSEKALKGMFPRHPGFVKAASINCADGKYRHCWVFDQTTGRDLRGVA